MQRSIITIGILLLSACQGAQKQGHPSARASLEQGRDAAHAWIASRDAVGNTREDIIALGYLERHRLGLGSPFRLIEYAMSDPRLSDSSRTTLAWSLLARTVAGAGYEIDGAAMDRGGAGPIQSWPGLGQKHLEIIANAIRSATDPRTGELAVRLGYALAATEGSLPSHAPRYAANAAAILRDRELAMNDAIDLVRAADAAHVDALTLMRQWRFARKFRVESPALATLPQEMEREALEDAPRIGAALRALGANTKNIVSHRAAAVSVHRSLLSPRAAARLLALADSMPMPPLSPLVVGARGYHRELVAQPWLNDAERVRRRSLETAGSEERFAARYALIERKSPYDVVPSLVALWSAVGMRAMSQEAVWYPGFPAPTARDLTQRYGLRSVTFGASVPVAWRPYYRRMIDVALTDMRLVLPALDVSGLSVRFQEVGDDEGTLALHDPKQRRLLLPPATAAGTLAHEIAHDIDWQVALRRYRVRGDYASDRAVREGGAQRDGLALRMQDLAVGSTLPASTSPRLVAHAHRPTEILARNVDFFITASLAEQGRVDGYLSSMQDEVLTGYGTVRAPELTGVAADALVNILEKIAPMRAETRQWFLRNYGTGRTLRSYDLARRVLESEVPDAHDAAASAAVSDTAAFENITKARALGNASIDAWTCRAPAGAHNARLEQARRALVDEAAAARARGYAVRRARSLMGKPAARWVAGQLFGAPWHVDGVSPEMEVYLGELVQAAEDVSKNQSMIRPEGFTLSAPSNGCDTRAITSLLLQTP
jgi:hypothetical protein